MKTTTSELKKRAKRALIGRYGLCIGIQFIIGIIVILSIFVQFPIFFLIWWDPGTFLEHIIILLILCLSGVVLFFLNGLVKLGVLKIYLDMSSGYPLNLSDLFFAFRNRPHRFLGYYVIWLLIDIIINIPFFLLYILAINTNYYHVMAVLLFLTYFITPIVKIIIHLHFSQSIFLLIDSPELGVFDSLKKSAVMMKGNKGGLFYLMLSFAGMFILGICSMYIGFLWIIPYIRSTLVEYYLDLKKNGAEGSASSMWNL